MDKTETPGSVQQAHFDRLKANVLGKAFGNYSKSYEFYKRISNIERCFLRAVANKKRYEVIDVGCGDGYHACLLNAIRGVSEKVSFTGIDLVPLDIRLANITADALGYTNLRFLEGSADNLDFRDSSFDIALCSDVIEHLPDPARCFREINRVLKPGGTLILTTPNDTSTITAILNLVRNRKKAPHGIHDGHISVKGLDEWVTILGKNGFRVSGIRRGALLFGGDKVNRHPVLFAATVLLDRLFDVLPFFNNWCEAITLNCIKEAGE